MNTMNKRPWAVAGAVAVAAMTLAACGASSEPGNAGKQPKAPKGDQACIALWNQDQSARQTVQALQAEGSVITGVSVRRLRDYNNRCLVTYVMDLGMSVRLGYQAVKDLDTQPWQSWDRRGDIPLSQLPDNVKRFNAHFGRSGALAAGAVINNASGTNGG